MGRRKQTARKGTGGKAPGSGSRRMLGGPPVRRRIPPAFVRDPFDSSDGSDGEVDEYDHAVPYMSHCGHATDEFRSACGAAQHWHTRSSRARIARRSMLPGSRHHVGPYFPLLDMGDHPAAKVRGRLSAGPPAAAAVDAPNLDRDLGGHPNAPAFGASIPAAAALAEGERGGEVLDWGDQALLAELEKPSPPPAAPSTALAVRDTPRVGGQGVFAAIAVSAGVVLGTYPGKSPRLAAESGTNVGGGGLCVCVMGEGGS